MKQEIGQRQFFVTPPHPCSYLPKRQANTLFLDPREPVTAELYSTLTEIGFRRSGGHLYRPHCQTCQACVPTRIPVASFRPRRHQRRAWRANDDLTLVVQPAQYRPEFYALYARYIGDRHRDGDMYPPSTDQFRSFLLSQWAETRFFCLYDADGRLMSVAVTDLQPDGVSAIYTFYEPDDDKRSLGVVSVLHQIEYCRNEGLEHVYLGYWIKDAQKMRYKTDYRPVQMFVNNRWVTLD